MSRPPGNRPQGVTLDHLVKPGKKRTAPVTIVTHVHCKCGRRNLKNWMYLDDGTAVCVNCYYLMQPAASERSPPQGP